MKDDPNNDVHKTEHTKRLTECADRQKLIPGLSDQWFTQTPLTLFRQEVDLQYAEKWNVDLLQDRILELMSQLRRVDSFIASHVILQYDGLIEGVQHTFTISEEIDQTVAAVISHRRQVIALRQQLIDRGLLLSRLLLARRRIGTVVSVVRTLQRIVAWDAAAQQFYFTRDLKKAAAALCMLQVWIKLTASSYFCIIILLVILGRD